MANKVKLTVTVDREIAEALDAETKRLKLSRSKLVQEAIKLFERKRLEERMKDGYQETAAENLVFAEEVVGYGSEATDEK